MANNKNTGTNFEKTQQSHSFPNYGTTADDISVSVPVTFTPTDAARLSKSLLDTDSEDCSCDEKKPLIQRRSSRMPLMHPWWYTSSPLSNVDIGASPRSEVKVQNENVPIIAKPIPHHEIPALSATFSRHKYYSKLVHHSDNRMRIPDHVLPSSFFYIIPGKSTGKQNSIVSIFSIWNTMMGTSLLTMPWGLEQAGFTLGVMLIAIMGLLTFYTAYRVLLSKDYLETEVFEFSDVCRYYLGRWGEWTAILFALVTFLGGMIVYWVLMTNFLYTGGIFIYDKVSHHNDNDTQRNVSEVLCPTGYRIPSQNNTLNQSLFTDVSDNVSNTSQSEVWSATLTVPLYLVVILLPLLNFKSPTFFTKFNCLGTLSVIFILTFVIVKAVKWGYNFEFTLHNDPSGYQLPEFRPTFTALTGLLSLAYFLHNAVITILKNNKYPENNVRDLSLGYLLVALTYLTVGVAFYLSFPLPKACIAANLLDNLHFSDSLASAARLILLFQMITVYPLLAYMFRVNALYAICNSAWPGLWQVIVVNILIVATCVLVAMFYPHIGDIIRYSGAFCGMVYIFFLPSLVYILATKSMGKLTRSTVTFHIVIMLFGTINFISQFLIQPSI